MVTQPPHWSAAEAGASAAAGVMVGVAGAGAAAGGRGVINAAPAAAPANHAGVWRVQVLRQVDAVSREADEEVLPLGAVLSQLPVDLAAGKMLV